MTTSDLSEMAEMAATATHEVRETFEHVAAELRETEAGFRLLRDGDEEDVSSRLQRACLGLINIFASQEQQLAQAQSKFLAILTRLRDG